MTFFNKNLNEETAYQAFQSPKLTLSDHKGEWKEPPPGKNPTSLVEIKGKGSLKELDKKIQSLINAFLSSQDIRENSKKTYERALRRFMNWISSEGIYNPSREHILAYKGFLEAQGLSSLTISNYMVATRQFFQWTEATKHYPNIAKGVKGSKRSSGFKKDTLSVNQIKKLLTNVDRSTVQGKRDYALLNLLIRTGLRTIEVVRANIEDGSKEGEGEEAVLWIQGKGRDSKDEFVLLTENTLEPIQVYLEARGKFNDKDPLFASLSDRNKNQRLTTKTIRRLVKEYLKGIGIDSKRLSAHSLRHTAITLCLLGGATIQEAQALGRHADINTTLWSMPTTLIV